MKTCRECGLEKPKTEYYLHVDFSDNRMHICKACHKKRMKVLRKNQPSVQARDRLRAKEPARRAHSRRVSDQWRKDHPERYRAQNALNNALRDGKIEKKPCSECATTLHVHGHHSDYSKPLDVTWLCAKCHARRHAALVEFGGEQLSMLPQP